jgi:hypothetical protein
MYGFSAGIQTSKDITISFRYLSSLQKYNVNQTFTIPSGTFILEKEQEQPYSSIQILVGICFDLYTVIK